MVVDVFISIVEVNISLCLFPTLADEQGFTRKPVVLNAARSQQPLFAVRRIHIISYGKALSGDEVRFLANEDDDRDERKFMR